MNIVMIGSVAHRHHNPSARVSGVDVDLICEVDNIPSAIEAFKADAQVMDVKYSSDASKLYVALSSKSVIEIELAWPGTTAQEIVNFVAADPFTEEVTSKGVRVLVPSLDVLYMLKMSHRYRKNSPHFLKTMEDIHEMRRHGAKIGKGELKSIYKRRMEETYDYKHPNLKQSKNSFFDDSVPYQYDHDSIHRAVAVGDQPAYTLVKDVQDEVFIKKENFFEAPREVQLLCTLEEAYVLSIERSIAPFDITCPKKQYDVFKFALMKVCTSITSGWFRQFSWENYNEVLEMYDRSYIQKFYTALEKGEILPFKQVDSVAS